MSCLSAADWALFDAQGFLRIGQVADTATVEALRTRIDDIMLGKANVDYRRMVMQLDSTDGVYESAGPQSHGFKGATFGYRKIEQLEAEQAQLNQQLADGSLYASDPAGASAKAARVAQIDDELLAALERWEILGQRVTL